MFCAWCIRRVVQATTGPIGWAKLEVPSSNVKSKSIPAPREIGDVQVCQVQGDREGAYRSKLISSGVFIGFVDEAWKNFESATDALNDMLVASGRTLIPESVLVDVDVSKLRPYLEDCLSFESFELHEKNPHDVRDMVIEGPFFARTLAINYRRYLFDIVAVNPSKKHSRRRR